jgi:hypothetical protein
MFPIWIQTIFTGIYDYRCFNFPFSKDTDANFSDNEPRSWFVSPTVSEVLKCIFFRITKIFEIAISGHCGQLNKKEFWKLTTSFISFHVFSFQIVFSSAKFVIKIRRVDQRISQSLLSAGKNCEHCCNSSKLNVFDQ